jgi:uncharacterized membrane protein YhaH (DUF805 family)
MNSANPASVTGASQRQGILLISSEEMGPRRACGSPALREKRGTRTFLPRPRRPSLHFELRECALIEFLKPEELLMLIEKFSSALGGGFRYSGRAARIEFWSFNLFPYVLLWLWVAMKGELSGLSRDPANLAMRMVEDMKWFEDHLPPVVMLGLSLIFLLLCIWIFLCGVALNVRRLHDVGLSGLFLLLPVIAMAAMQVGVLEALELSHRFSPKTGEAFLWSGVVLTMTWAVFFFAVSIWPGMKEANRFGEPE